MRGTTNSFVPLHAQTPSYMAMTHRQGGSSVDVKAFVTNKMDRQQVPTGRTVVKIVDQHVLYRPTLSLGEWIEQLRAVKTAMTNPGLELGLLPADVVTVGVSCSSTTFDKDVNLSESVGLDGQLSTEPDLIDSRLRDHDELCRQSLWGPGAVALLDEAIARFGEAFNRGRRSDQPVHEQPSPTTNVGS